AGDDQVVAAIEDIEIAPIVEPAEVAGSEPSVGADTVSCRTAHVTRRDSRTTNDDLADLARRHWLTLALDAELGRRQCPSRGADVPSQLIRKQGRHLGARFGQAVRGRDRDTAPHAVFEER